VEKKEKMLDLLLACYAARRKGRASWYRCGRNNRDREMVLAICTKPREEEFLERRHIDY